MVDKNLRRINAKRSSYDYQPGQKLLKKKHEWTKLGERWDEPFEFKKSTCKWECYNRPQTRGYRTTKYQENQAI